jgi:hypothetical protein
MERKKIIMAKNEMKYVIRKSWEDVASQAGLDYSFLANAKKACDKLEGYSVYDSNGIQVYPKIAKKEIPAVSYVGASVMIKDEIGRYENGVKIAYSHRTNPLFIIKETENTYILAAELNGKALGELNKDKVTFKNNAVNIETYIVQLVEDIPLYLSADANSAVINTLKKFSLFTIVDEKDGFGKIKKGAGWLELSKVKKL